MHFHTISLGEVELCALFLDPDDIFRDGEVRSM